MAVIIYEGDLARAADDRKTGFVLGSFGFVWLQGPAATVRVAVIPVAMAPAVVLGKTAVVRAVAVIPVAMTLAVVLGRTAAALAVAVTLVVPAPVVMPAKPAAVLAVALASVAVVPDAVAPPGTTAVKTWPAMILQRKSVAGMEMVPCVTLIRSVVMAYAALLANTAVTARARIRAGLRHG